MNMQCYVASTGRIFETASTTYVVTNTKSKISLKL